jgi:4,5-DOPA dioxygenase extradiol
MARMPVIFAAHGAPVLLDDAGWMGELAAWAAAMPKPRSILMVSAHWEERPAALGATRTVPLVAMYPDADVPVLQVSMPRLDPQELFALGQALAPLRDEGVLVFGSGFLTHNMRYAFRPGTPEWAKEFDAWAEDALSRFDVDALVDFHRRAPAARTALPTWEHYAPVLMAAGAEAGTPRKTSFPITGWWMDGAFTKRSVQFG